MTLHLQREIDGLKKKVMALSTRVEENVRRAVRSIAERDRALAETIIAKDPEIDGTEVEVEEECLKILALHQPVAIDLRYIVAVLKINNDLERIGDLAVNIAQSSLYLHDKPRVEIPFDYSGMGHKVQGMVSRSLDAFVNMDADAARAVMEEDDDVDDIHHNVYSLIDDAVRKHPDDISVLLRLMSVSHSLERIGDHATNIAEDIIYMVEGMIVRHSGGGNSA